MGSYNMTDELLIRKEIPFCINFQRFQAYGSFLSDDEIILFEWMTIKQSIVFKYNVFFYSLERIMKETHLKRTRIEKVIKRLEEMKFLNTQIKHVKGYSGKVRHFLMDFEEIARSLPALLDEKHEHAGKLISYYEALARMQKIKWPEYIEHDSFITWIKDNAPRVAANLTLPDFKKFQRIKEYGLDKVKDKIIYVENWNELTKFKDLFHVLWIAINGEKRTQRCLNGEK